MPGTLYIVGTPIGNLDDFSPRARRTLETVDFIAAEDTRVCAKLLRHFDLHTPTLPYYEHNKVAQGARVVDRLLAGESCALVTDAGMPAISDPGEDLVRACHDAGVPVESVPGPTALTTALALSGMPSGRFCFEGFLSTNRAGRSEHLASLANETRTMLFYEAPHKLAATLRDLLAAFGNRPVALVRELTKLHEEVWRTDLQTAAERYATETPRGEFVLVVAGAEPAAPPAATLADALACAQQYLDEGLSASASAKCAAARTGLAKGEIYAALTARKAGNTPR